MNTRYSGEKLKFAKEKVVPLLQSIPSLRRIGVYGSVADGKARPDSDIDLLIVCQDGMLHLCRWQVNWRLWQAGLRGKVSAGVVVTELALKPETFQVNQEDRYVKQWFKTLKWIYHQNQVSSIKYQVFLNRLTKLFFSIRFKLDQLTKYPAPHIGFSDEVFFHFGNAKSVKRP